MGLDHIQKHFYLIIYLIKRRLIGFCLISIAAIAIIPMFLHSYPITHSTQFNLSWAFQYQRQFEDGQFYPRWLEFSNFGFGNATFVFYPPMLMIATLPFSLLGMDLPASLVGSMVLAAFTLVLGVYLYATLYFPSWLALVVSGLAVASPYFLIDIYQRGAIAEVWAIAFIPWVLRSTHKLIDQIHLPASQRTYAMGLAIAWGMVGLSHLPTLLISFLAWLPMPLWLLKDLLHANSQEVKTHHHPYRKPSLLEFKNYIVEVGRCYLSAILGFVGISFFLLPVIFDQNLVQIESVNFSTEYLPQNRLLLDGLLSLHPKLSAHWFENGSGLIPYFGIMLGVMILSAIPLIWGQPSLKQAMGLWIMITATTLVMTTDLGGWIYRLAPTLQKIQFSWRWYGLTVTTIPMMLGGLGWQIWQKVPNYSDKITLNKTKIRIIAACLILGAILTGYTYTNKIVFKHTGFDPALVHQFASLASQKEFPIEPDATAKGTPILWWHWQFPDGLAIVDVPEYRAKGVTLAMPPDRNQPLASYGDQDSYIQIKQWKFGLREILVDNLENDPSVSEYLTLRMFYYPAWQVWVDGKKGLLEQNSQGQAQIAIANGQHLVLVKYVGTLAEQLGRAISWFSIILTSYIFWRMKSIAIAK